MGEYFKNVYESDEFHDTVLDGFITNIEAYRYNNFIFVGNILEYIIAVKSCVADPDLSRIQDPDPKFQDRFRNTG